MISRIGLMENVLLCIAVLISTLRSEQTRNRRGNPGLLGSAQSSKLPKTLTMIALSFQRSQALTLSQSHMASKRLEFRQSVSCYFPASSAQVLGPPQMYLFVLRES